MHDQKSAPATLQQLLDDPRDNVARHASVVLEGIRASEVGLKDVMNMKMEELMVYMAQRRARIPDKHSDLQAMDAVLLPVLELHRLLSIAQAPEDQLEVSELDLLAFGIDRSILQEAASRLGCMHLGPPVAAPPSRGVVIGLKKRVIVVRTLTIRGKHVSVAFLVDTGAPVTFICHETLTAFGLEPQQLLANFVQGFFAPDGPHHDINVLGMDYMLECDAQIKICKHEQTVDLRCVGGLV